MLPADEAHLYLLPEEALSDTQRMLLSTYLSDEEKIKWKRFLFEADQDRYLATRVMIRSLLSQYLDRRHSELHFIENQYGRPYLRDPSTHWLRFNLSHTKGMIVCLLANEREVGVDVEDIHRRSTELANIAERFFAPAEVAALRQLPTSEHRERFFTYWTLKESYIKARGMGLALPLEKFAFINLSPIELSVEPELQDPPAGWSFTLRRVRERFLLATTIEDPSTPLSIIERYFDLSPMLR